MAQYMKKGPLGRMVPAEGGVSDPELCEVRLTASEYAHIWDRLRRAERSADTARLETAEVQRESQKELERAYDSVNKQVDEYRAVVKKDAEARIKAARSSARETIEKAEQDAAQRIKAANESEQAALKRADQAEAEVQNQIYLNKNLKRIARERANADRGITPKKDHDGYIVTSSRQWTERYNHKLTQEEYNSKPDAYKLRHKFPCTEHRTAKVWKSIIQTPYDASIPIAQIENLVEQDDLFEGGILRELSCTSMLDREFNGVFYDFGVDEDGYEINGLYKWSYHANYKSGFWELDIYTTKSLRVPEYRRPVPITRHGKTQKHKKREEKTEKGYGEYECDDEYI